MKVKGKWLAIGSIVISACVYSVSAWSTRVSDLHIEYYSDATFSTQVGSYQLLCFSGKKATLEGVQTQFYDAYTTPCGEDWPKLHEYNLPWMGG